MESIDFAGVLSFSNDVRQKLGRKPVSKLRKGCPGDPAQCPVANTINFASRKLVEIDGATVELPAYEPEGRITSGWTHIADVPSGVADFIVTFDLGELPDFEGHGWAE